MIATAPLPALAPKPQTPSSSPHSGLLLQRKRACGSPTSSLTGESECTSRKRLQTKLTIGASNDPLEREADRLADQALASPRSSAVSDAPPRIQRLTFQAPGQADMAAPASVDRVLSSPGRHLEPELQQDMGRRFGHDFSRVRIHTDAAAERSARDVNANAYTVGPNIVFGAGRFAPGTNEGRRLIAHELTHVVQQRYAPSGGPLSVGRPGERSAFADDPTLQQVLSVGARPQLSHTGLTLQRGANGPGDLPRTNLTKTQLDWVTKARKFYNLPTGGPTESIRTIVGVLITEEGEVMFIKSGEDGGPWGGSQRGGIPRGRGEAFTGGGASQGNIATHVEGHAAAIMHQRGLTTATLIIEESPCKVCDNNLKTALPPGSKLTVVDPQSTGTYSDSHPLNTASRSPAPAGATQGHGRAGSINTPPPNTTNEPPRIRIGDAPPKQPAQSTQVVKPPPSELLRIYHGELRTIKEIEQIEAEADAAEAAVGGPGKQAAAAARPSPSRPETHAPGTPGPVTRSPSSPKLTVDPVPVVPGRAPKTAPPETLPAATKAPATSVEPTLKPPTETVKNPLIAAPSVKPAVVPSPELAPAPLVEGSPSSAVAPRAQAGFSLKPGAIAAGKALGIALIFIGLEYELWRSLEIELKNSIDKTKQGAMPWAQRIKREDPSKPVFMRVRVQLENYTKFIPLLGHVPDRRTLHMIGWEMSREELVQPLIKVEDHQGNIWNPGITKTLTYTEAMLP